MFNVNGYSKNLVRKRTYAAPKPPVPVCSAAVSQQQLKAGFKLCPENGNLVPRQMRNRDSNSNQNKFYVQGNTLFRKGYRWQIDELQLLQMMFPTEDSYFLSSFLKKFPSNFPAQVKSIIRRRKLDKRNGVPLTPVEKMKEAWEEREFNKKIESFRHEIPREVIDLIEDNESKKVAANHNPYNDFLKYGYLKKNLRNEM